MGMWFGTFSNVYYQDIGSLPGGIGIRLSRGKQIHTETITQKSVTKALASFPCNHKL